jgi:hypothetical protein
VNLARVFLLGIVLAGPSIQASAQSQAQSEAQIQVQEPVETRAVAQTHAPVQHIICNIGYTVSQCRARTEALRLILLKYPVGALGDWTWVVVPSINWKKALSDRLISPDVPAMTYLLARETYLDEALVLGSSVRAFQLSAAWNMSIPALLDLAIRHEMGHALCNNSDELAAQRTAALLQSGESPACVVPNGPAQSSLPRITSKAP